MNFGHFGAPPKPSWRKRAFLAPGASEGLFLNQIYHVLDVEVEHDFQLRAGRKGSRLQFARLNPLTTQ